MWIHKYIPLVKDLSSYKKGWIQKDLSAGLTVGVMLVPQAMAYAYLAGMPPIYGLYAGLLPLVVYAIFGSSRHLSVGPVAVSALLVYAGVKNFAEPLSNDFVSLAITTGFFIGLVQMSLSFLRLGLLVNFISHPVISGFTSAAAIIVGVSQLKDILGIDVPRAENPLEIAGHVFANIFNYNGYTLVMSVGALVLLIWLRKVNRKIPGALLVVVAATLISYLLGLEEKGVKVVGTVPEGLPEFTLPNMNLDLLTKLLPTILTVSAISIVESLGIAKYYEGKSKNYRVVNNQELFALGMANVAGALSSSMPSSGSFSRTAVNYNLKAKTGLSSIFSVVVVLLSLLFLTPLFKHLPLAVLASIILLAIKNLFDYKEAIRLWHVHRRDFTMLMVTFAGTLLLGIELGVLLGFCLSIVTVLYRSSQPNITRLGKIKNTNYYRSIDRYPDLVKYPDLMIIRFDDQLYYGNAYYFKDKMHEFIEQSAGLKLLVLDAGNIHDMDSTGLKALHDIIAETAERQAMFCLCNMTEHVEEIIEKSGLLNTKKYGKAPVFESIASAVEACYTPDKAEL
ncbi:sulfate permease [bacterium]|nr:sulfate permease [bacterium]